MKPHVSFFTLGVRDLNRAQQFYSEGLGWAVQQEQPGRWLCFSLNGDAFGLGLRRGTRSPRTRAWPRTAAAFRGITLSYIVSSEARVDAVLAEAEPAGGRVAKPAAAWGGYFGYFTDPDGYLWKVVAAAGKVPFSAE